MTVLPSSPAQPALAADPAFAELRRARRALVWPFALAALIVYALFVAAMAWAPDWLGQTEPGGSVSIGLPIGAGVILFSFALTGLYVWLANRRIEPLLARLRAAAGQK